MEYRVVAKELQPILSNIEAKHENDAYRTVLVACQHMLINQRQVILDNRVRTHIDELTKTGDLKSITRAGCHFMQLLTMRESELFYDFFSSKLAKNVERLSEYTMGLCGIFYEAIRPRIINELSVSMLCDVIEIMHRRTAEMSLSMCFVVIGRLFVIEKIKIPLSFSTYRIGY